MVDTRDAWAAFWEQFESLQDSIRRSRAVNINAASVRDEARALVQAYFRQARPPLEAAGVDSALIGELDAAMQQLLKLANAPNAKRSYQKTLRRVTAARPQAEVEREKQLGRQGRAGRGAKLILTSTEAAIVRTLSALVPSAALSYEQAIRDLCEEKRQSYRGTASELREALREVLDHMAPDGVVISSPGFKLEPERTTPTMRQKVAFVLRSRGLGKTASGSAAAAIDRVEASMGVLARSVYDRGSLSTHVGTSEEEVRQLKLYVDGVLAELLRIHSPSERGV